METLDALKAIITPGSVAELRVIDAKDGNYTANYTGYFDDMDKMAAAAARFDGKAPAVYFTLNQCNPALLARAANRMVKAGKKSISTSDHDITRLCWLPIDADAKRPAGISSSDAEHEAALWRVAAIENYLTESGWPKPIQADSGNGGHLLYKIDMQNTPENVDLIKNCILALSQRFSDDLVEIDKTVFNPSRIWKVYGTKACKGDPTTERPHRQAVIISGIDSPELVPAQRIKAIALTAKTDQKVQLKVSGPANNVTQSAGIDVEGFCSKHGLTVHHDANWKDGIKYQITPCPFNYDHTEAIIIKHPSGAVSFKCLHSGCYGKTWQDLREVFEPVALRPKKDQPAQKTTAPRKNTIDPRINVDADLSQMLKDVAEQAQGKMVTLPLPWYRLSRGSQALRPGTMTILAGPQKTGKSFFTMSIIRHINELGFEWAYLPLEDNRKEWAWRMLSILEEDYRLNEQSQECAGLRGDAMVRRMEDISCYLAKVTENPRYGIKDEHGNTVIKGLDYQRVLEWIKTTAKTSRVIVVDPISQIDFDGKDRWKDEADFVRNALGIISDSGACLILVAHTVKRTGLNASVDLSAEDVQGSAMYTRLAHTTLLLDACEMKTSEVRLTGGGSEMVTHNRVVTIASARNGSASRSRLAFLQDQNKPAFIELGFLLNKSKRRK
jgi:hypothetical protein